MKILEKTFTSRGFEHKQICREGDLAIYERWYEKKPENKHWEVIKIGRHEDYMLAGNLIPAAETYASPSTWGDSGFTCSSREAAFQRFDKMKAALESKKDKKPRKSSVKI